MQVVLTELILFRATGSTNDNHKLLGVNRVNWMRLQRSVGLWVIGFVTRSNSRIMSTHYTIHTMAGNRARTL